MARRPSWPNAPHTTNRSTGGRTCTCGPHGTLCLRKCCALGEVMNVTGRSCVPAGPSDLLETQLKTQSTAISIAGGDGFFPRRCPCKAFPLIGHENYTVLANASLLLWEDHLSSVSTAFCVDSAVFDSGAVEFFMLVCFQKCTQGAKKVVVYVAARTLVNYWCMLASVPFYVATLFVYAAVPRLRNLHGKTLMCHVSTLLSTYLLLPVVGLLKVVEGPVCITAAFIIYYAFLASFFWLNVMCLDIWWTFSGFRPMRGSVKEREHKKFVIYSLYCWGSPLIMLMIALIMDLHPGIPETYEKPGFGEKKCWFRSTISNLIYFSGPIAILIVCNIVLFILTAFKIRQIKRGTKILKKQDSRRHNEEEENNAQRFKLYLKLFSVMGVNWIMEVISFAAGGPDEWWYVTDIMNTLQGLLIFFIFVCKRRIFRLLKERFYPESAGTTNSINTSSTRMTAIRRNGSVMSSTRGSLKTQEGYPMKGMAASARSDDSDVA